jgi:hypothetical protein
MSDRMGIAQKPNIPVSQICALSVFPSTLIERVANSTPIVDFVSRLNSLRVNRESTLPQGVNRGFQQTKSHRNIQFLPRNRRSVS